MAGFGDLSYEPIELGGQPALRFTGGKQPFSLVGPEAVRLKSAIDRAKAAIPIVRPLNGKRSALAVGQIAPGNIDTSRLPIVWNPDGSYSTVDSMSAPDEQGNEVLFPTVVDGKHLTPEEAIRSYQQTGRNLGTFRDWRYSDRAAVNLHQDEAGRTAVEAASQLRQQVEPDSILGPDIPRFRQAIDRAKAAGPQPIAMNGNQIVAGAISGATGTGGVGPVDLRGTGGAQNLEQAAPTPNAATGGASGSWEPAPEAPVATGGGEQATAAAPQQQSNGSPYTRVSNDLVRDNRTGALLRYQAPVAASPGGWQGDKRQTELKGAHPLDPEIMAGMEKAYTEQIDQASRMKALNQQAAAETTAATRAELERQGAQKAEQERYVAEQRSLVQKAEDRRQAAEADYSASRVDPNRMFAGDTGTLRAIGAALAQAAGAFGAALSGTPNFAAQIVQAAIDRDVQAQRDEIRVKGDTADNALRDLMARGMKLDEATNALRGMQTQYAAQQLAAVKTAYGADEAAIAGDANMTALTQQYLQWKSDYTRAAEGEATIQMAEKYRAPTGGRAGGMVLATSEQIKDAAQAGTAFNKWQASGDAKAPQNVQERRIAGAVGELTSNYDMIKDMPADEVLPTTENQGILTRGYRAAENFIGGAGTATRNLDKATQKQVEMVNQVKQSMLANLSVAREQGVIRESEYGRAAEEITGAGTWGALQDISKRQINSFQARREAIRGAPSVGETLTQEQ